MTAFPLSKTFLAATPVADARRRRGKRAYLSGQAAEARVARDYEQRGLKLDQERYRGSRGEIDLIMRDGAALVFIEVKQSRTFDAAAESLSERQMRRIYGAAEEYLAREPMGQLTEARFDVALVDGQGAVKVLENAFGGF
ncbi:YraN family protein [Rhodalgimonas zhirmunskyi]|uniref:UPF0102 protein NOI20_11135 n=1 Tax=Rhodalgimonas zhirmunskyi TaxID=2964767 RepID=A0AAJ1U818_9RHOB|nr:YraN family protein [Rhodoalgimonas zhirmunskyi]MDQ2094664.1 YraN family protein [Rhodoalgimonas zhirmunskyi]